MTVTKIFDFSKGEYVPFPDGQKEWYYALPVQEALKTVYNVVFLHIKDFWKFKEVGRVIPTKKPNRFIYEVCHDMAIVAEEE